MAGDALDMATLAAGLAEDNPRRGAVGAALGGVAAMAALDWYCASQLGEVNPARPMRDYSTPERMRGQAARDAAILSPLP